LEQFEEAIIACDLCLGYDANNNSLQNTRERALKLKADKEKKEQARLERERQKSREKRLLDAAFKV
jgi:small subunit ribosomal protein S7e